MRIEEFFTDEKKEIRLVAYTLANEANSDSGVKRPAVLICPGGGYMCCAPRECESVALAFLSEGINAFVLYYSLNENSIFPQPLCDANWAMSLLHEKADKFNIDKEKIAVCGFSAGGHLAAAIGVSGIIRPSAMILGYPCIIMKENFAHKYPSLEKMVDEKTPKCYIFTTRDDNAVPVVNTLEFIRSLERYNIPFEAHIFAHGEHGLSLGKKHISCGEDRLINPVFAQWFPLCIEWLNL